jgi:16S rRNA (cytosine967-C5)-methyltransferase
MARMRASLRADQRPDVTPSARLLAAIELLEEIESADRRPADAIANQFFRERRFIGSGDRRAVSDRVWGVLRGRRRLGWWLERNGAVASPRLLVAAALLLEGWALEGVEKSFSGGQFAAAPLSAAEKTVLRPLETRTLDHPDMPEPVRLEIPDWVLPLLKARFGDGLVDEMAAMAEPAPLDLRVNLLKATRAEAQAALAAEGIEAAPTPLSPWGLRVAHRRAVTSGAAFQTGILEIQDEGSQLVALLVGAQPGMRVVDWCAGAAGKTLALAMTMQNKGQIVACDVSEKRLDAAVKRLRRAGVHNVERHLTEEGDKWVKRRAQRYDRVLVDAPCTGTGTWRRNPDGRLRLSEADLDELEPKQAGILDAAERLVRPGGRLIYATCSLLREENELQIDAFCARHPAYRVVPVSQVWSLEAALPCPDPFLVLTPLRDGTDGFFAAVLERAA